MTESDMVPLQNDPCERDDQAKCDALRAALESGESSGVADGGVFAEIRERIRRAVATRAR